MTRLPADIEQRLLAAAPSGIAYTSATDSHGVTVAWAALASKDELRPVAEVLLGLDARLAMMSASQPPAFEPEEEDEEEEEAAEGEEKAEAAEPETPMSFGGTALDGTSYEIAYHFDVGGDTLTVIAHVAAGGAIASLTPLFRTADWNEREIMEMYGITVTDHPDPRRLFLDPAIDTSVLERLIPFSTLVNAASTKGLWEKIMSGKAGAA